MPPRGVARTFCGLCVSRRTRGKAKVAKELAAARLKSRKSDLNPSSWWLDRVDARILEIVGRSLANQSDAAPFLRSHRSPSRPFLRDSMHGEIELAPQMSNLRAEHVAGQACEWTRTSGTFARVAEQKCDCGSQHVGRSGTQSRSNPIASEHAPSVGAGRGDPPQRASLTVAIV